MTFLNLLTTIWTQLDFGSELDGHKRENLLQLSRKEAEIFPSTNNPSGFCPLVQHHIETGDAKPYREQKSRFSYWQQIKIAKQMQELLRIGVVSPCESEYAANVILVKKTDGSFEWL